MQQSSGSNGMKTGAGSSGSRYRQLMASLRTRIEDGTYAVNTKLPTERVLSVEYGVSRATVREALRQLEQLGMIRRLQGAGTTVIADRPKPSSAASYSLDQLFQYPKETSLLILKISAADPEELSVLREAGAKERDWLRSELLRQRDSDGQPLFYTRSFLPARLREVFDHPDCSRVPFYAIMRDHFDVHITSARVEIQPTLLPVDIHPHLFGEVLDAPVAGLCLRRTYFDESGHLQQRSLSWHAEGIGGIVADFKLH